MLVNYQKWPKSCVVYKLKKSLKDFIQLLKCNNNTYFMIMIIIALKMVLRFSQKEVFQADPKCQ